MTSTKSNISSVLVLLIISGMILRTYQEVPAAAWHPLNFSKVFMNMRCSSGCYKRLVGISVYQCIQECVARIHRCRSVNYKRFFKLCELCSETKRDLLLMAVGVIHVHFYMDTHFLVKAVDKVCGNITCSNGQKCVKRDATGLSECEQNECVVPEFLNQRLGDKYINTGMGTKLLLQTDPRCRDIRKPECDIIECSSSGTWSHNFENKAFGKQAWQISTYFGANASFAVDGNKIAQYSAGSCSHTEQAVEPWWIVDLGEIHCINEVRIQNRGDCCHRRLRNLKVFVGEDRNNIDEICATFNGPAEAGELRLECCPAVRGRYVKLQCFFTESTSSDNYLTLCEVEVF